MTKQIMQFDTDLHVYRIPIHYTPQLEKKIFLFEKYLQEQDV